MKVILLEFVDEAKAVLNKYGRKIGLDADSLIICLHPHVSVFLKNNGIAFKDTLDYLGNDSQHRIILETERLTGDILKGLRITDSLAIEEGYRERVIHHLRMYISHFLWIIEILDNLKKKHHPREIHCCIPDNYLGMYTTLAYIQNEERFLGLLAKDFCKANGILFKEATLKLNKANPLGLFLTKCTREIAKLIAVTDYNFFIRRHSADVKTIIVPGLSYNMGSILKEIKLRHPGLRCFMVWEGWASLKSELNTIYLAFNNFLLKLRGKNIVNNIITIDLLRHSFKKDKTQQDKIKAVFEELTRKICSEMEGPLIYKKVPFGAYLQQKVKNGLQKEILSLSHSTLALSHILRRLKPNLLMAMYSSEIYGMMGELSHVLNFSSLSISHGTHVPPHNEFEKIENYRLAKNVILNRYKYVAVQTPWAAEFLDYYGDKRQRIVSGPLLYSVKDEKINLRKRKELFGEDALKWKVVVHATTQKQRIGMRFHITETLDEYISGLADLVAAVNALPGMYLLIRPHPACEISAKEFLALLPKCNRLKIIDRGPFVDVLSVADIMVSYSSTCIEEALQSKIPVILYDKWKRYNHFNTEETRGTGGLEKKPAYYITDPSILSQALPKIFSMIQDSPFTDEELTDYRYPEEFKENFNNFIDSVLRRGGDFE